MLALITNDDGIESPGLHALALAAIHAGWDVVVAAPSWDSSGASASLTAVESNGRFVMNDVRLEGVHGRCVSIEGAPAFITRAALSGSFGTIPDVVLSGINRGLNCGMSIVHSGTVGAAMTAASSGVAALAFSIDASGDVHWRTAQRVAGEILGWFGSSMPETLLNINVPNVDFAELRGLRVATLAPFGAVTAIVTERGHGHVTLEYRAPDEEATPGTDVALISDGFATVTALAPVCAREADLGDLVNALNSTR